LEREKMWWEEDSREGLIRVKVTRRISPLSDLTPPSPTGRGRKYGEKIVVERGRGRGYNKREKK
jgi:hypothetical protein